MNDNASANPADKHKEIINALKSPFGGADHEVRVGIMGRAKAKWWVYVKREAIQDRLDSIFGLDWQDEPISVWRNEEKGIVVTGWRIGIKMDGEWRWRAHNGSNTDNPIGEHTEKGAATDAFKRAASKWGIGLYLQNAPDIWSDKFDQKDWKAKASAEKEALRQVTDWVNRLGNPSSATNSTSPTNVTPMPRARNRDGGNGQRKPSVSFGDVQEILHDLVIPENRAAEVARMLGIERFSQWQGKKDDLREAVAGAWLAINDPDEMQTAPLDLTPAFDNAVDFVKWWADDVDAFAKAAGMAQLGNYTAITNVWREKALSFIARRIAVVNLNGETAISIPTPFTTASERNDIKVWSRSEFAKKYTGIKGGNLAEAKSGVYELETPLVVEWQQGGKYLELLSATPMPANLDDIVPKDDWKRSTNADNGANGDFGNAPQNDAKPAYEEIPM